MFCSNVNEFFINENCSSVLNLAINIELLDSFDSIKFSLSIMSKTCLYFFASVKLSFKNIQLLFDWIFLGNISMSWSIGRFYKFHLVWNMHFSYLLWCNLFNWLSLFFWLSGSLSLLSLSNLNVYFIFLFVIRFNFFWLTF
jgi:hypothetical protein